MKTRVIEKRVDKQISIGEELCSTYMSGHLADVTLGPKEWTSLILDLKRKWEELKSYKSTTYSLRKVTSEKPKDAS